MRKISNSYYQEGRKLLKENNFVISWYKKIINKNVEGICKMNIWYSAYYAQEVDGFWYIYWPDGSYAEVTKRGYKTANWASRVLNDYRKNYV